MLRTDPITPLKHHPVATDIPYHLKQLLVW